MVAALNHAGLRVVMDVVYNHTMADGLAQFSVLDRIVPGYYHRLLGDGTVAESTCCSNTAPEHHDDGPARGRLGRHLGPGVQGGRFPLRPDGPPPAGQHPRGRGARPPGPPLEGVGARHLPVRRGLELRRGGVRRPVRCRPPRSTWPAPGSARSTTGCATRSAAAARSATTRRCRASPPGSGRGTPLSAARPDQGGAGRWAGRLPVRHPHRRRAQRRADRLQRLTQRVRGRAGRDGQLRRRARQRDPLRRDGVQAAARRPRRWTGPGCRCSRCRWWCSGQGVGFVALGSERLRSKSLDRNSYNSGDWFNQIRWDGAAGQRLRRGPAAGRRTTRTSGAFARPLLADPALVPPRDGDRRWPRSAIASCCGSAARRRSSACRRPRRCSGG